MNLTSGITHILRRLRTTLTGVGGAASVDRSVERRNLLRELEQKIGYTFRDWEVLDRALSHRSYVSGTSGNGLQSYERLEFLGDAALGLIVSEILYHENPDLTEGGLTRTKSSLVSREALVSCSEKLDLGKYMLLASRENLLAGRARMAILSDCFEALLGAIYLDGGIDHARAFVKRLIVDGIEELSPFLEFHQAKNRLLRISQERHQLQPLSRITRAGGPEHDRIFTCEVSVNGTVVGRGSGRSKKEAEKWAAVNALQFLRDAGR